MMRLIDADAAIKNCEEEFDGVCVYDVSQSEVVNDFTSIIDMTPTVDAEPVRHGHWDVFTECANYGWYCSECHKKIYDTEYNVKKHLKHYCPNCGAKMDK